MRTVAANTIRKKLISTSISAMFLAAAGSSGAADVTIGNGGSGSPTAGQTIEFTGTAFSATGTATVADGITIGAVTATNDRAGTLTFSGGGGAGTVGVITANSIGVINAGANGKTVTFSGEVGSYNINVTGTGTVEFQNKAAGYINFAGGNGTVKLGNDLHEGTITTSTNNTGILELKDNLTIGVDTSAASGDIGTSSAKLNEVRINGGNVVVNGNIYSNHTQIETDHSLTVADGKIIAGDIIGNGGTVKGTLIFSGTSTVVGTVGSVLDIGPDTVGPLKEIRAGIGNVTFNGIRTSPHAPNPGQAFASYAELVTITGTGTVTFSTGLVGNTLAFGANDGTVVIGAGYNLASAVTNNANTGTVTFAGSTTTQGDIGSAAAGAKLRAVNFNGGTVSIGHDIAAADINFKGSSATTFTGNRALTGFVLIQDTASVDIGRTTLSVSGQNGNGDHGFTLTSGTTLKTELYDTGSANAVGKISATSAGAYVPADAKLYVNVTTTRAVNNGEKFLLIDGNTTDHEVNAITTVTDNSAVLDFTTTACLHGTSTCAATGGDDLYLIAHRVGGGYVTAASLPSNSPATAAANTLNSIAEGGTATGDMATVINTLNSHDAATLSGALKKAAPIANAATTSASFAAATGGLNTVTTRLAVVRGESQMANTGAMTGLAAGDAAQSRNFWMKGFGAWNKAGIRDGFDGYKAKSSGLSFGADTEITNGWTAGGALTYAVTSVDQQDTRVGDATQIKSYQLTGYAMKDFGPTYLDAMLSFARHNNKTHRATALARTANGNFDGDQWTARLAGGYRMPLGGKVQLVPLASLEWSTLKQKSYTEKGAGALNLSYQAQTTDSLKLGLGARITGETTWGAATVIPEAHAMTFHDFGDARTDTTASFTGGGTAFTTTGQAIQRNSYNLGGSLAFLTGRTSKVTVGYDFEGRKGFAGHSAQITGRWMF